MFQGHGFVGKPQLDFVAKQMHWDRPLKEGLPLRIVMMHHHVLPVSYREIPLAGQNLSVVLDAEAVVQWMVQHHVKIVLHGHMHEPFCAKVARTLDHKEWRDLWVLGMGSAGVRQDHVGQQVGKNTFGVLQFTSKEITFIVYSVHPTAPSEELWRITIPIAG